MSQGVPADLLPQNVKSSSPVVRGHEASCALERSGWRVERELRNFSGQHVLEITFASPVRISSLALTATTLDRRAVTAASWSCRASRATSSRNHLTLC